MNTPDNRDPSAFSKVSHAPVLTSNLEGDKLNEALDKIASICNDPEINFAVAMTKKTDGNVVIHQDKEGNTSVTTTS